MAEHFNSNIYQRAPEQKSDFTHGAPSSGEQAIAGGLLGLYRDTQPGQALAQRIPNDAAAQNNPAPAERPLGGGIMNLLQPKETSQQVQTRDVLTQTYGAQLSDQRMQQLSGFIKSAMQGDMSSLSKILDPNNKDLSGAFKQMMEDLGYKVQSNSVDYGNGHSHNELTLINDGTGHGIRLKHQTAPGQGDSYSFDGARRHQDGKVTFSSDSNIVTHGRRELAHRVNDSLDRE